MSMLECRTYLDDDVLERLKEIVGRLQTDQGDQMIQELLKEIRNIDPEFYFRCKERFGNSLDDNLTNHTSKSLVNTGQTD